MDEAEYRTYKLLKATVKRQDEEKKQELKMAEKKRKEIEGETPCKLFCSWWMNEGVMGANDCSPREYGYQSKERLEESGGILIYCERGASGKISDGMEVI